MAIYVNPFLNSAENHFNMHPQPRAAAAPQVAGIGHGGSGIGFMPALALGGFGGGGGRDVQYIASGDYGQMRQYQREDREESRASAAAVVGGIATVAFAAVSAFTLRSYCNDRDELHKAVEFKTNLNNGVIAGLHPDQRNQLNFVADSMIKGLETKCGRSRNIMILTGLALATGITAFVAGMMSINWLITASIIAGVAIAAIAAFTVVWYCTAKDDSSEYVKQQIQDLRQHYPQGL